MSFPLIAPAFAGPPASIGGLRPAVALDVFASFEALLLDELQPPGAVPLAGSASPPPSAPMPPVIAAPCFTPAAFVPVGRDPKDSRKKRPPPGKPRQPPRRG